MLHCSNKTENKKIKD